MSSSRDLADVLATLDDLSQGEALARGLQGEGVELPFALRDALTPASAAVGAVAALLADLQRLRDIRDALQAFFYDRGAYDPPKGHSGVAKEVWDRVTRYFGYNDDE